MDAALEQLRDLADRSEHARRNVLAAVQGLVSSLESPDDTLHRYGHLNLQTATVQVGINLGLFKSLTEASEPLKVQDITDRAKADLQLTCKGSPACSFGLTAPQYQCLPELLKQTGYKTPVDATKTAFHLAFHTTLDPFAWFAQNPSYLAEFNTYHALRRQPDATWLSVYPVEAEAAGWQADQPLYVNMGGGIGQQCAQFKDKYPGINGRIILQDLPHSVAKALPTPGVENMAHNMFEPQPVAGAKFYHLRAVFHNHPPLRVRMLLETIKAAMNSESVLLVDEMILPEEKVNHMAASIDMTVLSAFASMERTESQWKTLFEDVGLRLAQTYKYSPLTYESVMDVRLP
ncbi:putative O-methyl transferase B [Rosellinia necatrix]|uniref:Putative O-methyl transferase B n=1 Tax=Rosellinia necatrix TaxID=77044 RepID=A0A1W2TAH2_ROSNE|nr:putative O-methyl transferase B [Rosellinia necatrix]